MFPYQYIIYLFLISGVILSIKAKKLTVPGALSGGIIGFIIFKGGGYASFFMLCVFFVAGNVATGWKKSKKQEIEGIAYGGMRRTAGQVLSNSGIAAICAVLALSWPIHNDLFKLMIAGSLASATADTLSSELGMVIGTNFYNIITLKKDCAGLDGVISLEGTLTGTAGAALIALIYCVANGLTMNFVWIIIAGTMGNLVDSLLGATLERSRVLNNNMVNFLNTLTGALTCILLRLF